MRITEIAQYNYFTGINNIKTKQTPFTADKKAHSLTKAQMEEYNDLRVFNHHIYEYQKGLRNLILTTEQAKYRPSIEQKLKNNNIPYLIHEVNSGKVINVYFGAPSCIEVVKTFNPKLNKLTPEQDFILGIMLGYDRVKQCDRYMKIKNQEIKIGKTEE